MKLPDKIPGLAFWLDAADSSTINGGQISNGQFVNTFRDKSGGLTLTSPQTGGNFVVGAGPTYSVGAVNGKNAIRFDYFTSTVANNTSFRRLGVANCTPLGISHSTVYLVHFPYDVRQQPADTGGTIESRQSIVTVYPSTRVGSLIPAGQYADKQWFVCTYRNTNSGTGRNTYTGYLDAVSPYTSTTFPDPTGLRTYLYDQVQDRDTTKLNLTSGRFYAYGKVNIIGTRFGPLSKKHTIIRPDFTSSESFQPRYGRYTNQPISITNPILVIGCGWPGYALGGSVDAVRDQPQNQPFEGLFCEMLVFSRVLSDIEANEVEAYLKLKWIG